MNPTNNTDALDAKMRLEDYEWDAEYHAYRKIERPEGYSMHEGMLIFTPPA